MIQLVIFLFVYAGIAVGVAGQAWQADDERGTAAHKSLYALVGAFWPVVLGILIAAAADKAAND